MFFKKQILLGIFYTFLSIISTQQAVGVATTKKISFKNSDTKKTLSTTDTDPKVESVKVSPKTELIKENSTVNADATQVKPKYHYNTWTWAGAGLLFTGANLQHFIDIPTVDYQIGFAQSFWHVEQRTFWYLGIIADFAYSRRFLSSTAHLSYDSLYSFANEQLVLGYEQSLGTPYLAVFLEAGGAFQQRYFSVIENTTSSMIDYILGHNFGGTFNGGLNVEFPKNKSVSYLFRIAMNLMVGGRAAKKLDYDDQIVNSNQLTYSPSVSFGVRW